MRTVGQILRETRESKFYSLEEVEKSTKIQKKILQALEGDDYQKLPPPTFVQGFIKNYARFLGLDPQKLLAVFRREYSQSMNRVYVMDTFTKPIKANKLKVAPTQVLGLVTSLIVLTFFGYLYFQYRSLVGAPAVTLDSPVDQYTTDEPTVLVEGKTDPDATLTVNSQEVPLDNEGKFKQVVSLSSESNKLVVTSTSKFGQKTEVERTVYLRR
jgi:cytoskeletal protein RodZ